MCYNMMIPKSETESFKELLCLSASISRLPLIHQASPDWLLLLLKTSKLLSQMDTNQFTYSLLLRNMNGLTTPILTSIICWYL